MFFYSLLVSSLFFLLYPYLRSRYSLGFEERMGRISLPPREKRVWIHAVSVGEVKAAIPLVKRLSEACLSVTTSTGYAVARESGIEELFFYPWDLPWVVRRAVEAIKPSLYILVETELWPLMITYLKKCGVRLLLVNGRISERSYGGYKMLSPLMRKVVSCFDFIGAVSERDRKRFIELGAPGDRVFVMGNIKYDSVLESLDPSFRMEMKELLGVKEEPLWVCGSTHEGEEEIIVRVYQKLLAEFPDLRLALVPRHPERAGSLKFLLSECGLSPSLRSENLRAKVLIWDVMGELFKLYSIATVVFCGGSLVPLGGHNVIEPACWGKPVIYGPYIDDFLDDAEFLESVGAGFSVRDEEELYKTVRALLLDARLRERISASLESSLLRFRGVADRYMGLINDLLRGGVSH